MLKIDTIIPQIFFNLINQYIESGVYVNLKLIIKKILFSWKKGRWENADSNEKRKFYFHAVHIPLVSVLGGQVLLLAGLAGGLEHLWHLWSSGSPVKWRCYAKTSQKR